MRSFATKSMWGGKPNLPARIFSSAIPATNVSSPLGLSAGKRRLTDLERVVGEEGRVAREELKHEHAESVPVGSLSMTRRGDAGASDESVSGSRARGGRKRTSRARGIREFRRGLRREQTR